MGKFVVMQTIEFNDKTCGPCSQVDMTLYGDYLCRLFRVNLRGEGMPERCSGCKAAEAGANATESGPEVEPAM